MLVWLEQFLVRYPELALFLVIAAGYWIGSFKLGAFSLGPVTGSLFAGLFVGQFAPVPVSGMTKSFLFLLFLFGIGYSVGPQFMQSLKRDGLKPVLLAVVVCVTGLAASIVVAKHQHATKEHAQSCLLQRGQEDRTGMDARHADESREPKRGHQRDSTVGYATEQ